MSRSSPLPMVIGPAVDMLRERDLAAMPFTQQMSLSGALPMLTEGRR